ncbi:MAG: response regulator transcription factor [Lachnospiraceae bacterium]|nr:response regulator transcription factor [Lachnospiraceae bacterium]
MKLLLIEDDMDLCLNIKKQLTKEGYLLDTFHTGEEGFIAVLNPDNIYDLAIIDRMLPVIDGLSIIKAMRNKGIQIPVIVITGMSEINDRIEGLDGGADDYLVKPFHVRELCARIRALIRRPCQIAEPNNSIYGDLTLDISKQEVTCKNQTLLLTPKEFQLLQLFLVEPNHIFSREQLIQKVWETNHTVELGNVDNYIYFLRKRLKTLASDCTIRSVYGSGYILEAKNDKEA